MRDILIYGLMIAVVIILIRIIITTPFGKSVVEGFTSTPTPVNTMTECPDSATMYMYGGTAFCCSGIINPDADDVRQTCSLQWQRGADKHVFCTLGPESQGVPNCIETRAGLMQAKGETLCPPSLPNFCQGNPATSPTTVAGRCCQGPTNEQITDCMTTAPNTFCDMTTAENEFTVPTSCQFLRDQQEAGACPAGYSSNPIAMTTGTFAGMTLFGCTDGTTTCYQSSLLQRLQALGLDVSSLTECSSGSGAGSSGSSGSSGASS